MSCHTSGERRLEGFFNRRNWRNLPCRAKPNPKPNQIKKTNKTHSATSEEVKKQNESSASKKQKLANEHNLVINNLGWTSVKKFQSLE